MFNHHHHHHHIDLVITTKQMELFSGYMVEVFVNKTILFLRKNFPEWATEKDDAVLKDYIHRMMAFGKKHHVAKQINLQKLMHYHILYAFDIPIHKELEHILDDHQYNENNRVKNFRQYLQSAAAVTDSEKQ